MLFPGNVDVKRDSVYIQISLTEKVKKIMADVNSLPQEQLEEITAPVKAFILETFLPGEDPNALELDTALISGGIIDSISTLKLVTFLEEEFDIQVQANEMNADNLDTLSEITTFVISKQ